MSRLLALLLPALLAVPAPAHAAPGRWLITGPSSLTADVSLDGGTLKFGVSRAGRTVLPARPVGLRTTEADLTRGLRPLGRTDRIVTERYTMTTGKRLQRATTMSETKLAFEGDGGARLDLIVRVAPDGVAYRYVVPGPVTVTGPGTT